MYFKQQPISMQLSEALERAATAAATAAAPACGVASAEVQRGGSLRPPPAGDSWRRIL